MGDEETKTDVPEATENGTSSLSEKPAKAVAQGKDVKEDDGVKEMEEDKKADEKAETEKIDEDSEVKEEEEGTKEEEDTKEGKEKEEHKEKEESKIEAMEEENGSNENELADEKEGDNEDEKEKSDVAEDEVQKVEETKKVKRLAKHAKGKSGGEKVREKKPKIVDEKIDPEPRTPAVDRPVRERKSVERLVASIEKDSSKEIHIEKGHGTPLKDIPNVAFKLSRRKTDDTFRLLHSIIFGRRGKAFQIKSNISRFSGFVWHENEEKQRIKVKERFDKCNKEKLLEFCDVLDIPTSKTTRRKEDIVTSLIDFLEVPRATTNVLLAEKESNKSNKRKRVTKGVSTSESTPSKRSAKSQRKTESAAKTRKKSTPDTDDESEEEEEEEEEEEKEEEQEEEKEESKGEEKVNGVPEKSDNEMPEQSESEDKDEFQDDSEEEVRKRKRTSTPSSVKKGSGGKTRTSRTKNITVSTKKAAAKHPKADEDNDASPKVFSRKKKNEKATKEKTSTPTKSIPKKKPGEKAAKGKEKAKEKLKLTDEKLRDAICEILKEVDFNTATFTDILKQLARKFDTDLTSRKSSIKLMIQDELTKLADEADDEDGEGEDEKDETQAAGQEVEA